MNSIRHVGIVCRSIDDFVGFFVNELDFVIVSDELETGSFIDHLLGLESVRVRVVKLKDAHGGMIELLNFHSPSCHDLNKLQPFSVGITHIALTVARIDRLIEKTEARGYTLINPVRLSLDGKARVAYLRGPEDVLFELVEMQ